MSDLTFSEKQKLERLFDMGGGYVLNFKNPSFRDFIHDHARLDIDEPRFSKRGPSKANRLRELWSIEPNDIVATTISAMIEHGIEEGCLGRGCSVARNRAAGRFTVGSRRCRRTFRARGGDHRRRKHAGVVSGNKRFAA